MGVRAIAGSTARRDGMTLIEMLIVLAIVGVMGGMVVLGLGASGHAADPHTEANRLAEHLGVAVDDALVNRQPLALSWDAKGYGFVSQDADGRWTPVAQAELGARHDLPRGLTLAGDAPGLLIIDADATGGEAHLSIADARSRAGAVWSVNFDGLNATASRNGTT